VFGVTIAMAIGRSPKPDSIPSDSIELERSIEVFDLMDEGAECTARGGHPLNSPIPDFKTPSRANPFSRTSDAHHWMTDRKTYVCVSKKISHRLTASNCRNMKDPSQYRPESLFC